MAIWDYIATYNPTGFYEDNRAKTLNNDYMNTQISAAKNANEREAKIMALEDAWANGDADALRKLGIYAPEKRGKMIDNEAAMLEYARPLAQSFLQVAPENRAKAWGQIYNKLSGVMDMSDMSREYTPEIDSAMELIANSDAQKIRDERIDAMNKENATIAHGRDLEKMSIANEYQKERDEASFNRDIAKLQYAYDRADQKTKELVDQIDALPSEIFSDAEKFEAKIKALGGDVSRTDKFAELKNELADPNTTPERRNEILSLLRDVTTATSTKAAGRTPEQNMSDKMKALYNLSKSGLPDEQKSSTWKALTGEDYDFTNPDEDIVKIDAFMKANEANGWGLSKDDIISAVMKRNTAAQEGDVARNKAEGALQSDLKKIDAQTEGNIKVVNQQGQNAIGLENVKQGNRIEMADVTAANNERMENLKQKNRVALMFINDEISKGKELRELNNAKSLEEFKNSLPTEHLLELGRIAEQLAAQGTPRTVDQLLTEEFMNGLKTAELDRRYKQAQIEKAIAEKQKTLEEMGTTTGIRNFNYLREQGFEPEEAGKLAFGKSNVTVNNNEQDALEKELGKETAKRYVQNEKEMGDLDNQLLIIDAMEKAVSGDKTYQGTGGFVVNQMKTILSSLGFDNIEGLDDAAIINTGASMLMGRLRKDLMPGPLSDKDLQFLIRMTPSLDKTPEQNRAILNMYRKAFKKQNEYMQAYNDYVDKNRTSRGWKEWAKDEYDAPIFTEKEKAIAMGIKQKNKQSSGTTRNGKVSWEVVE